MTAWTAADKAELVTRWHANEGVSAIAKAMGRTPNSIIGKSHHLHLHFAANPKPIKAGSDPDIYGSTRFPTRVMEPTDFGVLKPGTYQRKLGGHVTKGAWKGMPIFSLTLEERATCPRSCQMWLSCMGNHMGRSVRYAHGVRLVEAIHTDLVKLQRLHPLGFVVRLHMLGDFFSVEYVIFWRYMLDEFSALRVFGYSAHLKGPIAEAIETLRDERWRRFAIRSSGAQTGPRTKVIARKYNAGNAIICPGQLDTKKPVSCGSCGLCWSPTMRFRPIAFIQH